MVDEFGRRNKRFLEIDFIKLPSASVKHNECVSHIIRVISKQVKNTATFRYSKYLYVKIQLAITNYVEFLF